MHLSLRQRVLVLLVAVNVAVVGAEVLFLARGLVRSSAREARRHAGDLASTLRSQIQPAGGVNVLRILEWGKWDRFADAILLDDNLEFLPSGRIRPGGVALNPKGAEHRPADFDEQTVFSAIALAARDGVPVEDVAGGWVLPIDHPKTGIWGACWLRFEPGIDVSDLFVSYFLPIFLFSTVVLSSVTFVGLRRFVLDPVENLGRASRRVADGDLSVRLEEPHRRDEVVDLIRTFNTMTAQVQSFNERLAHEVREATAQARRAESAAMTQRRLAATGELAAGIAHEINNPLGGLQNAAQALGRPDLPPEKRARYIELLQSGLERIEITVGQLLRFTPRRSITAPVRIERPVLDAMALVRHRAQREGVDLWLCCGGRAEKGPELGPEMAAGLAELPTLEGESNELGQAILNLLVNALDAVQGGGGAESAAIEIRLGVEETESGSPRAVVLEVADNGPGVPEDELARLSDLFYTTKEVGAGTGLGLAIVHNVVESHGGSLELSSRPGQGFVASVRLPARARSS